MSTATLPEVKLRAPEPTDTDRMYLWENDPEMWRFGYSPAPLSRQQIWEYISNYNADPFSASQLRLMIDSDGETVGTADLYDIDIRHRRAFVGIMIAPAFRRKGYALATLNALQTYCAENIGLHRIAATIASDNEPSQALFSAAGYTLTARLPRWVRRKTAGATEYIDAYIYILEL